LETESGTEKNILLAFKVEKGIRKWINIADFFKDIYGRQ